MAANSVAGAGSAGLARRYYFPMVFALLLALSLVAFGDNLVTNVGQPSNRDPKMVVHGLFALAWMVMLVLQATFVRTGNMRWHRRLGMAGFVAAIGVTLSTLYLFVAGWKGWAVMPPEVKANRILLPSFSMLVLLAYFNRRRPDRHKRLVYAGTLCLLEPILSRCFDPLVVPLLPAMPESGMETAFLIYLAGSWSGFFISLFIYDALDLKRIHPISAASFAWVVAVNVFADLA
jgi:hypothetical protein